jgi:hypothetical protein
VHQLKVFCDHLTGENSDAREIAARTVEARNEATRDWVGANQKNDWDRLCRRLERMRSWCATPNNDNGHLTANQSRRDERQNRLSALA